MHLQELIKKNLEQIRMLYLQTFEELTNNQTNIEIVIKEVLDKKITEDQAVEKINKAVLYAEELQKGFSKKMKESLNSLISCFPDVDSEEVKKIKDEIEKIYLEMEDGVSRFVEKVKELYKI
ncbi:MAG TPA: hypothetical protein PKW55_00465 [Spirochaetota bacterium]|nr:hypothetical protein [Spirochaetota bacterium]HOM37828.1 hypothetical protein [Spirochaetota bacterium]HPQ49295.1 hypothetical protein [Spirochaetota bacterium]